MARWKVGDQVRVKATGEVCTLGWMTAGGRWMVRGAFGEKGARVTRSYPRKELALYAAAKRSPGEDLPRMTAATRLWAAYMELPGAAERLKRAQEG